MTYFYDDYRDKLNYPLPWYDRGRSRHMYIIVWRKRDTSTKTEGPYYMKEESRNPFSNHHAAQEEAKRLASVNQDFVFYVAKLVTEIEAVQIRVTQL